MFISWFLHKLFSFKELSSDLVKFMSKLQDYILSKFILIRFDLFCLANLNLVLKDFCEPLVFADLCEAWPFGRVLFQAPPYQMVTGCVDSDVIRHLNLVTTF